MKQTVSTVCLFVNSTGLLVLQSWPRGQSNTPSPHPYLPHRADTHCSNSSPKIGNYGSARKNHEKRGTDWMDKNLRFVLDQMQRRHTVHEGMGDAWRLPTLGFQCTTLKTSLTVPMTHTRAQSAKGLRDTTQGPVTSPTCRVTSWEDNDLTRTKGEVERNHQRKK